MWRVRTVLGGVPGSPYYTNLFFDSTTGRGASDAHAAVVILWTYLTPYMSDSIVGEVEAEVAQIDPVNGDLTGLETLTASPVAGANTGDPLPWQTQALATANTNTIRRSRRVRGRTFVPGLCEETNQDGIINPVVRPFLVEGFQSLVDDPAEVQPVVWCRPIDVTGLPAFGGEAAPVTSYSVRQDWSYLRTRRD